MNLLKSPVSVICRFLSMKSKQQKNMSAFVHWTNNRTEYICSSGVGYHMRLWDTLLNVISTHKAFHFILLLQNDTKTEKTWSYAPLSPRVGKLTQGKYLHRIAQIISTTHWRLFPVFEWPGRAKETIQYLTLTFLVKVSASYDIDVLSNFPLSNLTHLDKPITQTDAENIYLCSLYKCFTFKPL